MGSIKAIESGSDNTYAQYTGVVRFGVSEE